MNYQIDFKPRAVKDLKKLPPQGNRRIVKKIEAMQNVLTGDVKRLTNFTPEYRLRVGDYRVLFEIEGQTMESTVCCIGRMRTHESDKRYDITS